MKLVPRKPTGTKLGQGKIIIVDTCYIVNNNTQNKIVYRQNVPAGSEKTVTGGWNNNIYTIFNNNKSNNSV